MSGRRRDKDGLTDKQRQSLPIIARAKSRHQGVLECEKMGIVRQSHYYNHWVKEPEFVRMLEEERHKYFEEVRSKVTDTFLSYAEILAQRLVSFGLQDGRDRLRAIEDVLTAIGVELGKGSRVDIRTNVVQGTLNEDIAERALKVWEKRARALEPNGPVPLEDVNSDGDVE